MTGMTQTAIGAEMTVQGTVLVTERHSELVGTQYLTPEQARTKARALMAAADAAEAAQQGASN